MISMDEQFEIYQEILAEGVERLKAMAFHRRRGWAWEHPDRRSPGSLKR